MGQGEALDGGLVKILAIEKELPGVSAERFKEHTKAEALRAWELYQAGVIRELYFRADERCAVIMLECADVDEARGVLKTLPFVKEGLIDFEIIPLTAYPGFERLFSRDS